MSRRRAPSPPGGLDIANQALHLLRTAPPRALACYAAGTLPFVLGLLYFWTDMSRGAFASERCFAASCAVAALFVWMKTWQAVFAADLHAHLSAGTPRRWRLRELARLTLGQTLLQPYGLLLIPLSLVPLLPFFPVYAFYQNVTALAGRERGDARKLARKAMQLSVLWPRQNCVLVWLLCPWVLAAGLLMAFGSMRLAVSLSPDLFEIRGFLWFALALALTYQFVLPVSPFGCVVAGNIGIGMIVLPMLLRSLLGVESAFTIGGWHVMLNTTYLMTVFGLSYLCLDPVAKAAYCLRCFYGEAQQTGEDLLVELRRAN